MGWLDRIFNAVENIVDRLTGREDEPSDTVIPGVVDAATQELEDWIKENTEPFDFERDIPAIGSLPDPEPEPVTDLDRMITEMGLENERIAKWALEAGWFDMDREPDERQAARKLFFDYTGMETRSFPWHAWREWYASAA